MAINVNSQSYNSTLAQHKPSLNAATFNRLSSGLRINVAADDTAGLGIATRISQQGMAAVKADSKLSAINDTLTTTEIASSSLGNTRDNLVRMRELAVQSSSPTLENIERDILKVETDSLTKEIDRTASVTKFNGTKLLDGTFNQSVQTGRESSSQMSIGNMSTKALELDGLDLSTAKGAQAAIAKIDQAIETVRKQQESLGNIRTEAGAGIDKASADNLADLLAAANSRMRDADVGMRDADVATESATFSKAQLLQQAGMAMLTQANQTPQQVLSLLR